MKYRVSTILTISVMTDVEADSEREARDEAFGRPVISLCYQCAGGNVEDEWTTSGELDGEPDSNPTTVIVELLDDEEDE